MSSQDHLTLTLQHDDGRGLAVFVSDAREHWTVAIAIDQPQLPRIELAGHVDLTALIRTSGTPGCLSSLLGGKGEGTAVLNLGAIEAGGRIVDAEGRANRFRGSGQLDVHSSATAWAIAGAGTLRARGLGRPVLWFAGARVRRSIERSLDEFWASGGSRMSDLQREMTRLRSAIDAEGGSRPFVRRLLWDRDFDPGLPWLSEQPKPGPPFSSGNADPTR